MRPRTGIVGLFFRATESLDLTSTQRTTIDTLEQQLRGGGSERSTREAFRADLAAGIRTGTIDEAKIAADEAAVDKAVLADKEARVAALDGLHGALDTAQRQTVADDVRQTVMQKAPHPGPHEWGDAGPSRGSALRLERLTKYLELDPSQQEQVSALISKEDRSALPPHPEAWDGGRKRLDALLTAFEQDSFDAGAALPTVGDAGHPAQPLHGWVDREVTLFERILPILKPEQREKLATYVEKPRGFERNEPGDPTGDPIDNGEWDPTNEPR